MRKEKLITAPDIDDWIWRHDAARGGIHLPGPVTPESLAVLDSIVQMMLDIAPTFEDCYDKRWEWIVSAPCGTMQQYVNERKDAIDEDYTETDIRKEFREKYPHPEKIYRITLIHSVIDGQPYTALFIGHAFVIESHNEQTKDWPKTDAVPFLAWLKEETEKTRERVRSGTYATWLAETVPKEEQYGLISRKVLRDLVPAIRQRFLEGIQENDLREFLAMKDRLLAEDPMAPLISEMTLRTYLRAAALCLRASGCRKRSRYKAEEAEKGGRLTDDMAMYLSWADGRDDGLCQLPEDDPEAFRGYCQEKEPWYKWNGGHPWEIRTSMSIEHSMHLYPAQRNYGWCFLVSGSAYGSSAEALQYVLALHRAGLPVILHDAEKIIPRFTETDAVAICPDSDPLWAGVPERVRPYANDGIALSNEIIEKSGMRKQIIAEAQWLPEPELAWKEK